MVAICNDIIVCYRSCEEFRRGIGMRIPLGLWLPGIPMSCQWDDILQIFWLLWKIVSIYHKVESASRFHWASSLEKAMCWRRRLIWKVYLLYFYRCLSEYSVVAGICHRAMRLDTLFSKVPGCVHPLVFHINAQINGFLALCGIHNLTRLSRAYATLVAY